MWDLFIIFKFRIKSWKFTWLKCFSKYLPTPKSENPNPGNAVSKFLSHPSQSAPLFIFLKFLKFLFIHNNIILLFPSKGLRGSFALEAWLRSLLEMERVLTALVATPTVTLLLAHCLRKAIELLVGNFFDARPSERRAIQFR